MRSRTRAGSRATSRDSARAPHRDSSPSHASAGGKLLDLQNSAGNRAVQRMVAGNGAGPAPIQRRLFGKKKSDDDQPDAEFFTEVPETTDPAVDEAYYGYAGPQHVSGTAAGLKQEGKGLARKAASEAVDTGVGAVVPGYGVNKAGIETTTETADTKAALSARKRAKQQKKTLSASPHLTAGEQSLAGELAGEEQSYQSWNAATSGVRAAASGVQVGTETAKLASGQTAAPVAGAVGAGASAVKGGAHIVDSARTVNRARKLGNANRAAALGSQEAKRTITRTDPNRRQAALGQLEGQHQAGAAAAAPSISVQPPPGPAAPVAGPAPDDVDTALLEEPTTPQLEEEKRRGRRGKRRSKAWLPG